MYIHTKTSVKEDFLNFVDNITQPNECSADSSGTTFYLSPKKSDRPKVGICPHKDDYCDSCSKYKNKINSQQTTINGVLQSGSASLENVDREDLKALKDAHEADKLKA